MITVSQHINDRSWLAEKITGSMLTKIRKLTLAFALLKIVDNTQACRNPAHNVVLRIRFPLVFLLIKKIKEIVMKNLVKVFSIIIFLFSGLCFADTTIVDVFSVNYKKEKP